MASWPSPWPRPLTLQDNLVEVNITLLLSFSNATVTSHCSQNNIQAPCSDSQHPMWIGLCLLIYFATLPSFTTLKTHWPSLCLLNFPQLFPFERLCTCRFFCLGLQGRIVTSLLPYQFKCSCLRIPSPRTVTEGAPPSPSAILPC